MDLQEACNITEQLLENDSGTKQPKLTAKEFSAINAILLELQVSGKHVLKENYSFGSDKV